MPTPSGLFELVHGDHEGNAEAGGVDRLPDQLSEPNTGPVCGREGALETPGSAGHGREGAPETPGRGWQDRGRGCPGDAGREEGARARSRGRRRPAARSRCPLPGVLTPQARAARRRAAAEEEEAAVEGVGAAGQRRVELQQEGQRAAAQRAGQLRGPRQPGRAQPRRPPAHLAGELFAAQPPRRRLLGEAQLHRARAGGRHGAPEVGGYFPGRKAGVERRKARRTTGRRRLDDRGDGAGLVGETAALPRPHVLPSGPVTGAGRGGAPPSTWGRSPRGSREGQVRGTAGSLASGQSGPSRGRHASAALDADDPGPLCALGVGLCGGGARAGAELLLVPKCAQSTAWLLG